jgi:hypothetical protein
LCVGQSLAVGALLQMLPAPVDELCRSRCTCRSRAGCALALHPKFKDNGFYQALMWKTLVNAEEIEAIRQPFLDILDEWIAFESTVPESCQHVLAEFDATFRAPPPSEAEKGKLKARLDALKKDQGLPPAGE